jgi:hypothetical protein
MHKNMVFSNLEYCYILPFHEQLGQEFLKRLPEAVSTV